MNKITKIQSMGIERIKEGTFIRSLGYKYGKTLKSLDRKLINLVIETAIILFITILSTFILIKIIFFADDIVGNVKPGYSYGDHNDICFTGCYSKND